jgi:hypothetical protein
MIRPSLHFQARKGESITAAWDRLSSAMKNDTLKMVSNTSLRRRVTPHGTVIKYLSPATWDHPFRVSANDEYVQVGPGTVNGLMPYIQDAYSGEFVRLNGLNQSGQYVYENGVVGVMKMDKTKVNDDFGLYVMVRIKRDKNSGVIGLKLDDNKGTTVIKPEDLQITLEKEYDGPDDGANSEFGYHPIGFVQFDARKEAVTSVSQVCHFNLKYEFQDRRATSAELADDPKVTTYGRHIFYPQ